MQIYPLPECCWLLPFIKRRDGSQGSAQVPHPLQSAIGGCQAAPTNLCVHIQWGRVDEMCNAIHKNTAVMLLLFSHWVVSDSLWLHGLEPTRLLYPWEFSRQERWHGLPCPSPGHLPNPGIEPMSPALQADSLSSEPAGKPCTKKQSFFKTGRWEEKGVTSYMLIVLSWRKWRPITVVE